MASVRPASLRFTFYGALFGCCFPVGSILLLVLLGSVPANSPVAVVASAHMAQPLLYIIDTAPFFLGFFAYLAGIREERLRGFNERLEAEVQAKTEELRQALREANEANELITHMAEHDDLCELLNRRCFTKVLESWLRYSQRYELPGALLFLDLDGFKGVNDAHGHEVGDALLCEVAERLAGAVREADAVARWGGDEFVVLLPRADREAAKEVANKLLARLEDEPVQVAGREFRIQASIGITLYPDLGTEVEQLLAQGDHAMYQAKQRGGGCWHIYSERQDWTPPNTPDAAPGAEAR